jgi:hypothetical protein
MRFASHALATCAFIAGLALLASTASAQLPSHLPQLTVGPNLDDVGPDPEFGEEPEFGSAVAIRDELMFVGMPAHSLGGRVAVFRATPTELFRTGTLTASDAARQARSTFTSEARRASSSCAANSSPLTARRTTASAGPSARQAR